jgi:hypothetical protein
MMSAEGVFYRTCQVAVHTLAAMGLLDTHEAAGVVYWCVASGVRWCAPRIPG